MTLQQLGPHHLGEEGGGHCRIVLHAYEASSAVRVGFSKATVQSNSASKNEGFAIVFACMPKNAAPHFLSTRRKKWGGFYIINVMPAMTHACVIPRALPCDTREDRAIYIIARRIREANQPPQTFFSVHVHDKQMTTSTSYSSRELVLAWRENSPTPKQAKPSIRWQHTSVIGNSFEQKKTKKSRVRHNLHINPPPPRTKKKEWIPPTININTPI